MATEIPVGRLSSAAIAPSRSSWLAVVAGETAGEALSPPPWQRMSDAHPPRLPAQETRRKTSAAGGSAGAGAAPWRPRRPRCLRISSVASSSARSFQRLPACPLTQSQRIVVLLDQLGEAAPEVLVLEHPLLAPPAAGDPAGEPLGDPLPQIEGVGEQVHPAAAGQGLQGADGRRQLHAVVGGGRLAAGELARPCRSPGRSGSPPSRRRPGWDRRRRRCRW